MFKTLMTTRRFAPLFWCQFFSALNDNFVKNALVMLILFSIGKEHGAALVALAGSVLIFPFFVFSGIGGELADRYDKAVVAERLKRAELPVAAIAACGFVMQSVPILFVALGLYGLIAALFGPIKYGILPNLLSVEEVPAGNAFVESATFAAILIGTIVGGLAAADADAAYVLAGVAVGLGGLGWITAALIPKTGAGDPNLSIDLNPLTSTVGLLRQLRKDRRLWIGGLITSWFWLVGAYMLTLLPVLMKDVIGGNPEVIVLSLVAFTIGIAIGSAIAARVSDGRPNLAFVPLGALLMAAFGFDLAWVVNGIATPAGQITVQEFLMTPFGWRVLLDLTGLAVAGGFYIVPSFAAVQLWAPVAQRARVIAGCNVLSAAFMTVATVALAVMQFAGLGLAVLFALLAVGNVVAMGLIVMAWRRQGLQDLGVFVFKLLFGLKVKGREHLDAAGDRMIITPNHLSFLDAPILFSVLPSNTAFAIDTDMAKKWWVRPFLRFAKVYPVNPTNPMAMREIIQSVADGETLVVFPEGRLTVTGGLMKVYDGTAMVADKAKAVVVPVHIEGAERSYFSYLAKSQVRKQWFPRVRVTIQPPKPLSVPDTLNGKVRREAAAGSLQDVMVESAMTASDLDRTLFQALADARKTRDTGKPIIEDHLGTSLSYGRLVLGAQILGAKLAKYAPEGGNIGVLLPNSAGTAVTFFGLQSIGRVPAMLNFSAGLGNVRAACTAASIETVVTSRAFVEKANLHDLVDGLETGSNIKIVYLEDIKASITGADKIRGMLAGSRAQSRRSPDDPAAILFTSGTEGFPKGVVLSHRNLLANALQSVNRVSLNGEDKVFSVLPVFHSFGMTVGMIMPIIVGVPIFFYPSPLHYRIVPELVYLSNSTILLGTDTFLNGYARSAHAFDFARLRLIIAGAEAVKDRTRRLYMEKFGVRISEGYGVTETAPVLAVNTPLENRTGTVGRFLPLVEARLDPVPGIEEGGRLFVRGPNVMMGYLRADNPGHIEALPDGWHDTGDIVSVDAQGYVSIRGRAKRFAKIAGEMISLAAVEMLAAERWPDDMSVVVTLPDARKGERLVLLATNEAITREEFSQHVRSRGFSELFVPAEIMVIPEIPLLGSGKADYGTALAIAKDRAASATRRPENLVSTNAII